MRALVTGAAGFIGSTLVDRLLHDGHQVVGIDNLSSGVLTNLDDARRRYRMNRHRFTFVQTDVLAPEMTGIVAGSNPDVIFHLAAQVNLRASVIDPLFDARHNVLGTINILEAARKSDVSRIVYTTSGGSRYGAPDPLPVAQSADAGPVSPNAVAKLAGELYLFAYAEMYGISPICLALPNVYGPRQNPHGDADVVTVIRRAMLTDNATVPGDGTAAGDYVYVDDVVHALVRSAQAPHHICGTYNVGTGRQATELEVQGLIAELLGSTSSPCNAALRSDKSQAIALHATKAECELGWAPKVELRDGIERTIRWLREILTPEAAAIVVPETVMNQTGLAALQTQ